jgi:uncharacterized lipoprotein YajG
VIRKVAILLATAILLAGCQTDQPIVVTATKYRIVIPADAMYKCPNIQNLPDPEKLTDRQVAQLLSKLSENNAVCRGSLDAIKVYLNKAKKEFEG